MPYLNPLDGQPDLAEKTLKAIIDSAIDGIVTIDVSGTITSFNKAASQLFGYTPHEVIGRSINLLMPAPDKDMHSDYIANYLRSGERKIIGIGREVLALHKDGHTFPIRLAVSEVRINDQRAFTGIVHDLTEIKKAEKKILILNQQLEAKVAERTEELASVVNRLLAMNKTLQHEINERKQVEAALKKSKEELHVALQKEKELSELKSRFVSMASHEFRTPLSTILSSTALLARYTSGEQQSQRNKHIKRIKSAVTNLNAILNDFLSLSKLEEGKIEYRPEYFDFHELCREVSEDIQGLLRPEQQIIHEHSGGSTTVYLDKRLVKNILFNMFSNAIKYSSDGSLIYCRTHHADHGIRIEIEDEGMGIPMHDQQYLFTRFFRASNATNIQGTGLGLTIVKQYVDLMGGSIRFTSVEEEGTTFIITLPQNSSVG